MEAFVETVLQVTTHIIQDVVVKLLAHVDVQWFGTLQGVSTYKVFIRKYLLRCWEAFNHGGGITTCLRRLQTLGKFEHERCLFDFLFLVLCEQMKHVGAGMLHLLGDPATDPSCHLSVALEKVQVPFAQALRRTRYGCVDACQHR